MPIKAAAPALIVAALALVVDYSTAKLKSPSATPHGPCSTSPTLSNLRGVLADVTHGWLKLDLGYAKTVAAIVNSNSFDDAKYLRNIELLKAVRQLESDLKRAEVPSALSDDHINLRRAVAKVRGRLITIDGVYQQFLMKPEQFPSQLSADGLRDLADHTTRRLGHLA